MIKRVTLKNFQSHKDSTFEFCPTTNSIVGSSNNGKTVVLRAISWVVTNRPSADSLISHWAKDEKGNQTDDTSVTIETEEHTVTRLKTKKTNTYIVDGKVLDAVGRDVPKEVSDALNMNEVNIQKQMDAPFLLSDSPGEVARFFNKLIKLDKIDVYLSAVESKKRKTRDTLNLTVENKGKAEKELEQYTWTDKASEIIDELKPLIKEDENYDSSIGTLKKQIQDTDEYTEIVNSVNSTLDKSKAIIDALESLQKEAEQFNAEYLKLNNQIQEFSTNQNTVQELESLLSRSRDLVDVLSQPVENYLQDIVTLTSSIRDYKQYKNIIDLDVDTEYASKVCQKLYTLEEILKDEKEKVARLGEQIQTLKSYTNSNIDSEIKELENSLPPFCPTCGGPIHG